MVDPIGEELECELLYPAFVALRRTEKERGRLDSGSSSRQRHADVGRQQQVRTEKGDSPSAAMLAGPRVSSDRGVKKHGAWNIGGGGDGELEKRDAVKK